jgi:5-formyltetrahydrofolate cyclo-ligase
MSLPPEDVIRRRVKAELRKRMRALRNTAPASACEERSAKIRARLAQVPAFRDARAVALFWPIEGRREVDLRPVDAELRARGVAVAYPAIDPGTREMTFRVVDDPDALEEQGMGFREPPAGAPVTTALDAIVVPALALDPAGHRIGYGAGFYDRALSRMPASAVKIAVGYDYQLLAEVPAEDHDVRMHWIVTDTRTIEVS